MDRPGDVGDGAAVAAVVGEKALDELVLHPFRVSCDFHMGRGVVGRRRLGRRDT